MIATGYDGNLWSSVDGGMTFSHHVVRLHCPYHFSLSSFLHIPAPHSQTPTGESFTAYQFHPNRHSWVLALHDCYFGFGGCTDDLYYSVVLHLVLL